MCAASGDHARPDLRWWDLTGVGRTGDAVPNRRHHAVCGIPQRRGDNEQHAREPPRPTQSARNPQRRRRAEKDLAVFDQDDAARAVPCRPELGEQFGGTRRLGCTKSKVGVGIARRDESDRSLTERTGAIEEDDAGQGTILREPGHGERE